MMFQTEAYKSEGHHFLFFLHAMSLFNFSKVFVGLFFALLTSVKLFVWLFCIRIFVTLCCSLIHRD